MALANQTNPTCLAGLDLALKWVRLGSDPEVARCTAAVATQCGQRHDCPSHDDCLARLHDIEAVLETLSGSAPGDTHHA